MVCYRRTGNDRVSPRSCAYRSSTCASPAARIRLACDRRAPLTAPTGYPVTRTAGPSCLLAPSPNRHHLPRGLVPWLVCSCSAPAHDAVLAAFTSPASGSTSSKLSGARMVYDHARKMLDPLADKLIVDGRPLIAGGDAPQPRFPADRGLIAAGARVTGCARWSQRGIVLSARSWASTRGFLNCAARLCCTTISSASMLQRRHVFPLALARPPPVSVVDYQPCHRLRPAPPPPLLSVGVSGPAKPYGADANSCPPAFGRLRALADYRYVPCTPRCPDGQGIP